MGATYSYESCIWSTTLSALQTTGVYLGSIVTTGSWYMATSVGYYNDNVNLGPYPRQNCGFVINKNPPQYDTGFGSLIDQNGVISHSFTTSATYPYIGTIDGMHAQVYFKSIGNDYLDIADYKPWRPDNGGELRLEVYQALIGAGGTGISGSVVSPGMFAHSRVVQWI